MVAIRRSGGLVTLFYAGRLPDPRRPAFAAALAEQRFRTIENAASEEVSVGWVTALDPTGDSFAAADLDAGVATWLRLRIDKKVLPKRWLAIHRDAAAKAKGGKLSARERRELRDDLMQRLLPRVLPTVNLVDALLFHEQKLVLLFATGRAVREAFQKAFFTTFTLPLEAADPLQLGLHTGLGDEQLTALERVEAVRWPDSQGNRVTVTAARPAAAPPTEAASA